MGYFGFDAINDCSRIEIIAKQYTMKKFTLDPESFERLSLTRMSNNQLLMVKGGGSNPPTPNQTDIPSNPSPTPAPNSPGNQ